MGLRMTSAQEPSLEVNYRLRRREIHATREFISARIPSASFPKSSDVVDGMVIDRSGYTDNWGYSPASTEFFFLMLFRGEVPLPLRTIAGVDSFQSELRPLTITVSNELSSSKLGVLILKGERN